MVEPGEGLFGVFGRGAVFHGDEFFSDAHSIVLDSSDFDPCQLRRDVACYVFRTSQADVASYVSQTTGLGTVYAIGWR